MRIQDYHAIKSADIKINGITVIAGENGSGKSTMLRWLHNTVKVLNEYEDMVYENASKRAARIAYMIERVIRRFLDMKSEERFELNRLLHSRSVHIDPNLSEIKNNLDKVILILRNIQKRNEIDSIGKNEISLIFDFLDLPADAFPREVSQDIISVIEEYINREYGLIESDIQSQIQNKTWDNFIQYLKKRLDPEIEGNKIKIDIEFFEDNENLFKDSLFRLPLNLTHSMLLSTDKMVSGVCSDDINDKDSEEWLYRFHTLGGSSAKTVARVVEKIIQGRVVAEENEITHDEDLKYRRVDGLDIYLKAAATGIISFSCILRMLENGWIDNTTLLIIDEPEAHLHPQWIVEYARMLVLINKYIGAKIVLASHNPDMVSAIQSIATREGVLEFTDFYIAEKTEPHGLDSFTYIYRDCCKDIGPIFDSFNIALDRISLYGEQV